MPSSPDNTDQETPRKRCGAAGYYQFHLPRHQNAVFGERCARKGMMSPAAVILDTNVFVAAGFNRRSASARIIEQVRSGQLRMIWNDQTRRETQHVLSKIPQVSWSSMAELFREANRYAGHTSPEKFDYIQD